MFSDPDGVFDLKLGLNHGIYIQDSTRNVYSWGDDTFGQTGNDAYNSAIVPTRTKKDKAQSLKMSVN